MKKINLLRYDGKRRIKRHNEIVRAGVRPGNIFESIKKIYKYKQHTEKNKSIFYFPY